MNTLTLLVIIVGSILIGLVIGLRLVSIAQAFQPVEVLFGECAFPRHGAYVHDVHSINAIAPALG